MDDTEKKRIGQRLNAVLAMRNVRQKELAQVLGVQDNAISYFCKGDRTPNTVQLAQICRYLNVSADYLLGLSDAASSDLTIQEIVQQTGLSERNTQSLLTVGERPEGQLELELANFLLESVFGSNVITLFATMKDALKTPSAMGCGMKLLEQWPQAETSTEKMLVAQAVMSETEAYFSAEGAKWTLEPEEAFHYYCSKLAEDLRNQLETAYEDQNQWGNLEGIREELTQAIRQRIQQLRGEPGASSDHSM